jgi:hypothetical protein
MYFSLSRRRSLRRTSRQRSTFVDDLDRIVRRILDVSRRQVFVLRLESPDNRSQTIKVPPWLRSRYLAFDP